MSKILDFSKGDAERRLTLCLMGMMILFLAPMSIYRLLEGDIIQSVINLIMSAIGVYLFVRTWQHKTTKGLNFIIVAAFLLVITVMIYLKGLDKIFWVFPAMIGTYFLLSSTSALLVNASLIMINTILLSDEITKNNAANIFPSLILVCFFGYFLSKRAEYQNDKLSTLASEDTLTGVKNRRSFDNQIQEILANQQRKPKPVSMLVLDLDFFKRINDSYGHKKGDQVLFDFANTVKSIIRTTDCLYRIGGEEFVIIANNSALENSGKLAESIRELIMQSSTLSKFEVTVSIGVAEILAEDDADSWFRRADRALYEAKDSGRNKVILAKPDEAKLVENSSDDYPKSKKTVKPISSIKLSQLRRKEESATEYFSKGKQVENGSKLQTDAKSIK